MPDDKITSGRKHEGADERSALVEVLPARRAPGPPLEISPVQAVLEAAAVRYGDRPALQFMDRRITYAGAGTRSPTAPPPDSRSSGSGPASMSACSCPNTPHYVIAFFGVLKAGGDGGQLFAARRRARARVQGRATARPTFSSPSTSPRSIRRPRALLEQDPPEDAGRRRLRRVRRRPGAVGRS